MFSELAIIFNQFSYVRLFSLFTEQQFVYWAGYMLWTFASIWYHFENRRGLDITFEVTTLKQSKTMMVISDLQNWFFSLFALDN